MKGLNKWLTDIALNALLRAAPRLVVALLVVALTWLVDVQLLDGQLGGQLLHVLRSSGL